MKENAVNPAQAVVNPQYYTYMVQTSSIRPATRADFAAVSELLQSAKLPVSDLNPALIDFFIVPDEDKVAAVMGMDRYGQYGLLRSAATAPAFRNKGLAAQLEASIEQNARLLGIQSLYLITNTAETWFAKKGFIKIERAAVPEAVLQSKEFNGLCPSGAAVMMKTLSA